MERTNWIIQTLKVGVGCLGLLLLVQGFGWSCSPSPSASDASEIADTEEKNTPPEQRETDKPTLPENPLEKQGKLELISDKLVFSEGPLWDKNKEVLLFSDVLVNKIYQLTLPSTLKDFRKPSQFSNGLAFDHKGRLLAAERTTRRISQTLASGKVETLADQFEGKKFHSPNDLTVRADGTVYFTDPPYVVTGAKELTFNGVFRVTPDRKVTAIWKGEEKTRPNGIILSPDEKRLYFADASAATIWVADVEKSGNVGKFKVFVKSAQSPDGMTIDRQENLYIATREGIQVFSAKGKLWGTLKVPTQPTNCTFGGKDRKTLFITARTKLFKLTNMPFAGSH